MVTRAAINQFLQDKKLAIAGVSRNEKKFGYTVFHELKEKGYEVFPINPSADKIDDTPCFKKVSDLPSGINSLLILTPKEKTDEVLREAINKGMQNIWVQQFSETSETIKMAEEFEKEIITRKCIFMFAEPVKGIHKFHRSILKLFGALPK